MSRRPLASFEPFLVAANVRGRIDVTSAYVTAGRGYPGHLVIGSVMPHSEARLPLLDQERGRHLLDEPRTVVAVLGPRDSSTHVCATIPSGGLQVEEGTGAHWVAGESGIVGCLERGPAPDSIYRPETAVPFRCAGLIADDEGLLHVRRFAVRPLCPRLSAPIVMVAATSSEAGKTILAGELIRRLTRAGLHVAAIKVTGTGGVMDSMHHAECGAVLTLDQVDAGLITTHGNGPEVREQIPLLFRRAEDHGVDLIVAELGGDLVSASNPVLFDLPELIDQTRFLLVIANDALSAAGVVSVNARDLHFPAERIRFLSSPFRNHAGMSRRMTQVGVAPVFDPCSGHDLDRIAAEIAAALPDSTRRAGLPGIARARELAS